jgi:hypothetical protein
MLDAERHATPDDAPRPDADEVEDAEEAANEVVDRNPDPLSSREAFEREIAERGESEAGQEVGTLVADEPAADRRDGR